MQKIIPTILLKQLEQLDEEICFTNSKSEERRGEHNMKKNVNAVVADRRRSPLTLQL